MVDPEQAAAARREHRQSQRTRQRPADSAATDPSPVRAHADRLLARLRDVDAPARDRRWLAAIRGDRRPATPGQLQQAMHELAEAEGLAVTDLAAGVDGALREHGDSIAAWVERLQRPKPRLGRRVREQAELFQ